MSSRTGIFNRTTGKWIDSGGKQNYAEAALPYITRRENLTFNLSVYDTDGTTGDTDAYTGWATGGPYTFRFFVDNDWNQYIEGELQTAISAGAITQIKIDNFDTTNGTPLSTGKIVLTNSSLQSETFAYTAMSEAGGVYTFTVSATATYSYALDDSANVVEPTLIEVENANIDQTDIATGLLVVDMDADNQAFINACNSAAGAEVGSCLFELQVYDGSADIVDSLIGSFRCLNLLVDDFATPPAGGTTNYYTKAQSDARYILSAPLTNVGRVVRVASTGALGESDVSIGAADGIISRAGEVRLSATGANILTGYTNGSERYRFADAWAGIFATTNIGDEVLTVGGGLNLSDDLDMQAVGDAHLKMNINAGATKTARVKFGQGTTQGLATLSWNNATNELSLANNVASGPILFTTLTSSGFFGFDASQVGAEKLGVGGDTYINGALTVVGDITGTRNVTPRTTTYTALTTDDTIDCTTGTFTVTLYTAVGNEGRLITVTNSGSGTITVDGDGTETIMGALTWLVVAGDSVSLISNGTQWILRG